MVVSKVAVCAIGEEYVHITIFSHIALAWHETQPRVVVECHGELDLFKLWKVPEVEFSVANDVSAVDSGVSIGARLADEDNSSCSNASL